MATQTNNLAGQIVHGAIDRGWGDRIALRQGDRVLTFAELADQVSRAATALRTLRVRAGDRVAVFMSDSIEAAVSILGVIYGGGVAVPLSELARPNDLRDRLLNCGAVAAIVDENLQPIVDQVRTEVPELQEVIVLGTGGPGERDLRSLLRGSAPAPGPVSVDASDVALILYSAGSRAASNASSDDLDDEAVPGLRGVPHSHSTPMLAVDSFARKFLGLSENDRIFSVVRLSTAYGLSVGLFSPLALGAESILLAEQPLSRRIFTTVDDYKPTVLFATPSVYRGLARDAEEDDRADALSNLKAAVSGAEDMPEKVIARVRAALGTNVVVGYGLTEAFQFVLAGPARPSAVGSCGKPVPGFDVRIVDDHGNTVGEDNIGTLQIRGGTVVEGYWGAAERPLKDNDGWFTTSDRFMVDGEGNYYHCGRADDLFKVGGKWVWPAEVERALLAHEAVWECAVVGADDEDGLIKPQAFIVANIGHEPGPELQATLRKYVKNELAPYKYPRWIEFVDELPKGPNGKILRFKLRDQLKASRAERRAETSADA